MSAVATAKFLQYEKILRTLFKAKPDTRSAIISEASDGVINALSELIFNLRKGVIHLQPSDIKTLRRYKKDLKDLSTKRTSIKAKKDLLIRNPGLVRRILKPLIPILDSNSNK